MVPGELGIWKYAWYLVFVLVVYFIAERHRDGTAQLEDNLHYETLQVELIELNEEKKNALIELGLTPRDPLKIFMSNGKEKTLHGRFLHITDIHPDPFYKKGTSHDKLCHLGKGDAGKYGDAILGCDSPMSLMNATIEWIKENLQDKIDFIIWTGDNVRHDNDRKYPRTEESIFQMNELLSDIMFETFKNHDPANPKNMKIDLIPSLGNNDVYPHNMFAPGPTLQTREMFRIWKDYIPPSQLHVFNRGAYFFQEVIPDQLAILSINTLYLYQSNPLADNCDKKKQPGYKLFEWLGYVLKEMRVRKMKVWLTGHVPPNEKNYDVSCLRKYIAWTHEYRDVIVGGLYGHMNLDHFIPLDSVAAYKSIRRDLGPEVALDDLFENEEMMSIMDDTEPLKGTEFGSEISIKAGIPYNKVRYMDGLREDLYAAVKGRKKSGKMSERYSIAHVSASVVPTFNPGLRVWEYNTTDLDSLLNKEHRLSDSWESFFVGLEKLMETFDKYDIEEENIQGKKKLNAKKKKKDKALPPKMPSNLPLGPAYSPQTFTPLRYVQYYADLESINNNKKKFKYELEYSTDKEYGLKDLTTDLWIQLARKLGKPVKNKKKSKSQIGTETGNMNVDKLEKMWKAFLKHAFTSSGYELKGFG
ncbi:uncharacterized protein PRCAT00001775001 [Priceomyces carsonii]|uniref:uncharacterized protein n=1 Tax=Priceomyces carsonii TaxID=28549 RepID=UPI002EDA93FD|nr:unnamed protein product [Priceomyces carsonii]